MSRRLELDPGKAALLNKKVEQIIETLRYALKKDGRTATAISRKAGMSGSVLNNMINGNLMSLKALILIAEEMGLEIVIQEKEEPNGTK